MTAPAPAVDPQPPTGPPTGPTTETRHLRLLPTPAWEPPEAPLSRDGADDLRLPAGRRGSSAQPELALDFRLDSGLPAVPATPALRRVAPRHEVAGPGTSPGPAGQVGDAAGWTLDDDEPGPTLTARDDLPDPQQWAARLAQAVVEIVAGARPASQLWRWTTQPVLDDVRRRIRPAAPQPTRPARSRPPVGAVIRSVHVCEPADGIAEVTAIVHAKPRTRALALRLEGLDGRWLCTALDWV
jgi:hypothetical protein